MTLRLPHLDALKANKKKSQHFCLSNKLLVLLPPACLPMDRVQIQKDVISDLKRENQFFSKEMESIYAWSLEREICKPVLKLDFTAQGIRFVRKDNIKIYINTAYPV